MLAPLSFTPIGIAHTPFKERMSAPRQPAAARDVTGVIELFPGRSFEHFFTRELDRIGPTISVGRPGERLAPLGASRDYLDSPDWKSAVGTPISSMVASPPPNPKASASSNIRRDSSIVPPTLE